MSVVRILLVEDDRSIANSVVEGLTAEGFSVDHAGTGAAALAATGYDMVLLDLGLPDMDGRDVCRQLRTRTSAPIIMLTARAEEFDRVLGLELGADDYITKPFSPREVVARIKSVVRRAALVSVDDRPLEVGSVVLDPVTRRVTAGGEPVSLTATEFDLLAHLMSNPGRVYSREQLLSEVWGYAAIVGTRTVDVHVAQVRSKLGDSCPIRTVRGVGYSAEASESS